MAGDVDENFAEMSLKPQVVFPGTFEKNFKYKVLYTVDEQSTLTEVDIFNDHAVLYIQSKGRSKVHCLDLVEKTQKEIRFKEDNFGTVSPLTNYEPGSDIVQFSFDNPFVFNE